MQKPRTGANQCEDIKSIDALPPLRQHIEPLLYQSIDLIESASIGPAEELSA
jgi:hypothetical protein